MQNRILDRRSLLRAGSAALAAGLAPRALANGVRWTDVPGGAEGRSLVLVQLTGGNDGLATVVPYGDDALHAARRTTVPETKKLRRIDDYRGFAPALSNVHRLWDAGHVAVVEGCGYPDPVRSHFKSYEVLHTARAAGRASGEGWVGRLVQDAWNDERAADTVVHFGGQAPYSLYSATCPPVALVSPTGYRWFGDEETYALGGAAICEHETRPARELDPRHRGRDAALIALRATLDDAQETSQRIRRASAAYATEVEYPRTGLGAALRDVAALVEGGEGTRVFSVQHGGYDTHTDQANRHGRQMQALDAALGAFLDDLARSEAGRNTLVLVFSEFGRRVAENGSRGHDHGKAGPMFVLGAPVKGGLYGQHPSLEELDEGDLVHTTDFRRVYATLVGEWFGARAERVLGGRYAPIAFV